MVRSKWPEWGHVQAQFAHQSASLQVLADEWAERYGLALRDITDRPVRCEYWTGEKIGREVDKMAILEPRLTREGSPHVAREPYTHDAPITVLDFGEGRRGLADGRHRADKWRNRPHRRFPVFVVSCHP